MSHIYIGITCQSMMILIRSIDGRIFPPLSPAAWFDKHKTPIIITIVLGFQRWSKIYSADFLSPFYRSVSKDKKNNITKSSCPHMNRDPPLTTRKKLDLLISLKINSGCCVIVTTLLGWNVCWWQWLYLDFMADIFRNPQFSRLWAPITGHRKVPIM